MADSDSIRKAFFEVAICAESFGAALLLEGPESPAWLVLNSIHDLLEVRLEQLDAALIRSGICDGPGEGPGEVDVSALSGLRSVGGSH